jgi:hypothetical protein
MARLESPLGIENGQVEESPQAHLPEGIYIARTLVRDRRDVPVRDLNATHQEGLECYPSGTEADETIPSDTL